MGSPGTPDEFGPEPGQPRPPRPGPNRPEPEGLIGYDPYAPTPDRAERHLTDPYGPAYGFGRYGRNGTVGMKAEYIQPGTRLPVDEADLAENSGISAFAHWGTLLLGFWAPLFTYLAKKDNSPYTRLHAPSR